MRIIKIVGIVLAILVVVVLIAGFIFVRSVARKGLPDYNATVELAGMKEEVTIYRDSFGIPHIYAKNESDLARAVGYCQAQDRLWQMDLLRRACSGRLSEIFGEDLIETDLLMRSLRIPEKSQKIIGQSQPNILSFVEAYADGVNQFISRFQKKLPPEFSILGYKPEPWEPEHSLYLIGYMTWTLSASWPDEIVLNKIADLLGKEAAQEFIPDWNLHQTSVFPQLPLEFSDIPRDAILLSGNAYLRQLGLVVFSGSNNWAVSGERSVTGSPILANDTHLPLGSPGIWYQIHMVVEGEWSVTGTTLPGNPAVVLGHNDFIAWGFTNVMVDNIDFYLEKINPDNPIQYEFNGEWRDMEVRKEEIKIKRGEIIEEELRFTHRGPIISRFHDINDKAISMRWSSNDFSDEPRSLYLLNRARNWEEFKEAMRTFGAGNQNVVYADVEGNIGLYCCAGVPIRKGGESNAIFPGWTDEYDWQGYVPFEELPHSFNPKSGVVSSANNRTAGGVYPYYISRWFSLPYRIDRIREMLGEKEKLSSEDFKRMQADQKSALVEICKDAIVAEVRKAADLDDREKRTLESFDNWDGVLSESSAEAALFETFVLFFLENTLKDELGEGLFLDFLKAGGVNKNVFLSLMKERESAFCDDKGTEGVETFTDIVQKSFKDTVGSLRSNLGDNPASWQWGKIHKLTLEHPMGEVKILNWLFKLNRGPYEMGGSYHTVCANGYSFRDPFKINWGPSQRHIYSLADWDESLSVIATGVSGIPASPHYCDQSELYVENKYHPDHFSRDVVESNARYITVIRGK